MAKRGTHKPRRFIDRLSAKVEPEMYEWVQDEAARWGINMAKVVRLVLLHYKGYVEAEMAD